MALAGALRAAGRAGGRGLASEVEDGTSQAAPEPVDVQMGPSDEAMLMGLVAMSLGR